MRKIFLLLFAGMVVFGCKDAVTPTDPNDPNNPNNPTDPLEVQRVQNVLAFNFSGNWCGPCGSNGIPALYSAKTAHGDKFHGIKVGLNGQGTPDPYYTSSGSELSGSYYPAGQNGIPGFGAAEAFFPGSAEGITAWRTKVDQVIATPASSVRAGLAVTKEIKGDSLIFNVRIKTFSGLPEGLYTVTVLVAEDDIVGQQQVGGNVVNPFTHKMVYRGNAFIPGELTYGVWGHGLSDVPAPIAANTTIEKRFGYVKPAGLTPDVSYTKAYAYAVLTRLSLTNYKPAEIINSARTK
jgi:hypothetical protein